ncbi:SDR family NAD(P)-dependent oxidoreductase [Rosistilla oblonga]|uniref:SDR family NAD(P)-dependent oxidoreductase n=1 Tax=Rosistilla oblonga TaxID=2527990 RepID=UPI003A98564B
MTDQPLAVVGMACRFPKGLDSITQLWEALKTRFNAIDTIPADRWDVDRYYSSNPVSKGKAYIRRGGFLHQDPTTFDASFFGISPREAENMDPQQRLMLEVVWEAFENAGIPLPDQAGKSIGVYVGGFMLDHMITQMSSRNRSQINQHSAAGMMMTMLSNRISHTYDLRGPSLSIDTACSSSLVAFHYACQDLWRGTAQMAIVGGVNVMMRPEYPMGMCKGHFLSRDGESKSFDARGDGYGRGEGAGVVLLKPLEHALRDGDEILSTVIGSGTNQDGCTAGISMPSGGAQHALIQSVCQRYQIYPLQIKYVECHGTGTAIGDPTECQAIGEIYGQGRHGEDRVVIGSIKSNTGHMEACAGIAGVIKGVLTTIYRQAAPLANLQTPNEAIEFEKLGLRLADDLIPLGRGDEPICVAVNSFGYGGSNAHVILQSAPAHHAQPNFAKHHCNGKSHANGHPQGNGSAHCNGNGNGKPLDGVALLSGNASLNPHELPLMLPVSARSTEALRANAGNLESCLANEGELHDVLYTAARRRAHLAQRAVVIGSDRNELRQGLRSLAEGQDSPHVVVDSQPFQGRRECVFVFTGMGPQWWGMGQELYRKSDIYRQAVAQADMLFQEIAGFSILTEMLKGESSSRISRTQYAQPANLLIQIGLLEMLEDAGVTPAACVGHSVGELGSAYAAGVLSLEDVLTVSFHRSQLQATTAGTGSMLAVGIGKQEALQRIAGIGDLVSLAAVNGTNTVTLAGDTDTLTELSRQFTAAEIFNKMLTVEVPYHSPLMDPLMAALERRLSGLQTSAAKIPLYSTVTGRLVTEASFDAAYWPLNIRQPVEFADAVDSILDDGFNTFLEVGPHPVLSSALRDCIHAAGKECRLVHTLHRKQPEIQSVHRAIAGVFTAGCEYEWSRLYRTGKLVSLPNYAWQRERLWLENDRAAQDRINPIIHPILGTQEALSAPVWRNDFDHEAVAYLRDHIVAGIPVLPAAAYIESLLELAAIQFPDAAKLAIRALQIAAPMIIAPDRGLDFTTTYDASRQSAQIRSLENGRLGTGQVHVTASIAPLPASETKALDLPDLLAKFDKPADVDSFYRELRQVGLMYGPYFQAVKELRIGRTDRRVLARIEIDDTLREHPAKYKMHPTLLDGCFQTLMSLLVHSETTYLPTQIGELCLYVDSLPDTIWCLGKMTAQTDRQITCDLTLCDDQGQVVGVVRSLVATAANRPQRTDQFGDVVKRQILDYQWRIADTLDEPRRLGHWLVVGASNDVAQQVSMQIENYGAMISGRVEFGDAFVDDGGLFCIRPDSIDDTRQVLNRCGELDGVVFFNSLDVMVADQDPTGEQSIAALVTMTQAMLEIDPTKRPRAYVVTQSAFAVDEEDTPVEPRQTAVNGFVRVAANELEGFHFTSVDLPASTDHATCDAVALELLCDAVEDEVAIRNLARWTSELLESPCLDEDRIEYQIPDDQHPIQIRPLRPGAEQVGTVRILAAPQPAIGPRDVRVRVEKSLLPLNLVLDQSADHIEQPLIEIVGTILEAGNEVDDLRAGMQVCGFAPADLASQLSGRRDHFHLVEIPSAQYATQLVANVGIRVRARCALHGIDLESGDAALVDTSPMSLAVAELLAARGVRVSVVTQDVATVEQNLPSNYNIVPACPESLHDAVQQETGGRGFTVLVAGMQTWLTSFDLRVIVDGGAVVDTDDTPQAFSLPTTIAAIARTDLAVLAAKPSRLCAALEHVVGELLEIESPECSALEVSVADVAWQVLPLRETKTQVVISYDTRGQDLPIVQRDDLRLRADATYLITGGFGGFGRKTARWLIEQGARHLVLTGRASADDDDKKAFVQELESLGASVHAAACDTSDFGQVQSLLGTIQNQMPPLKGVFHSAAVIMDQAIADINLSALQSVLRSKALGAWNLHLATEDLDLDHFVLYSSLANQVGNSRQAAYCAANGFLNGLAHHRKAIGLPATSVCWGAISDVGVVARDEKLEQFLRYVGLRGLPSAEALGLLRQGLARDVTQFGMVLITSWADWARFETLGGKSPRFAALIEADSAPQDNALRDQLIEELSGLSDADQIDLVAGLIREIVGVVLKSDPEAIAVDRPVSELGVDSLMATEIQQMFDSQLGLKVSVLELVGEATIRSLAVGSLASLGTAPSLPSKSDSRPAASPDPTAAAPV